MRQREEINSSEKKSCGKAKGKKLILIFENKHKVKEKIRTQFLAKGEKAILLKEN